MTDLGTQEQPGDAAEALLRIDRATELAEYFLRQPGPAGSVRYRIENLSGCQASEHELDRLVEMVEYILDLVQFQQQQRSKCDGC